MNNLTKLREARGLSQREVAKRLGTDTSTVSRLENGQRRLTQEYLVRFMEIYEVPAADILGEPERRPEVVRRIKVFGTIDERSWTEAEAAVTGEAVPVIAFGQFRNFDHRAYRLGDDSGRQYGVPKGGFVVGVPYVAVRRQPLDGDLVVLRMERADLERRLLRRLMVNNATATVDIGGKLVELPAEGISVETLVTGVFFEVG